MTHPDAARERAEKRYVITGGKPLYGAVSVGGAKNAIGKQLVASLLTDEPCTFSNVPRIEEIKVILEMLGEVGTRHQWLAEDVLEVHTPQVTRAAVSQTYSAFNRIPILMIAPLMHRAGEAEVPMVGGCNIGPRPVDFHIDALREMGAQVEVDEGRFRARGGRLRGTTVRLPYPSVGATENVLVAATLSHGTTVIENAAVEPEIVDTILFLQAMGALVAVEADRRIVVEGVERLGGASHGIIPDRIEAASFAVAAVVTGGEVEVRGARQEHLITFLNQLRRAGGGFRCTDDGLAFYRASDLRAVQLDTDVHPGFMTDWQQPFVVLLTQAEGVSVVHETVYEERFGYTRALVEMGANIQVSTRCLGARPCRFSDRDYSHSAMVSGPAPLRATRLEMPDLRAAFAYVLAALAAEGTSKISGVSYIERGYADVPGRLRTLGADIEVRTAAPSLP